MRFDRRASPAGFSSYAAGQGLKDDQTSLATISFHNTLLGDIERHLMPGVGAARAAHFEKADAFLKTHGTSAAPIVDDAGVANFASPAYAITEGYGVQFHKERESTLPECISWPGGQGAAASIAPGALVFAILDAGVLVDVGASAAGSGRVAILPGDTVHATLRCLDSTGRTHKVVGTALLSKKDLLPKGGSDGHSSDSDSDSA